METVIVINPDRFSRQSFPPFIFVCRALLQARYNVKCIGARKYSSLPDNENFEFISPFNSKPILYGVWFVLFSIYRVIKILSKNKVSAIFVFRSCDSLTHFITSKIFRTKLVFFVDHLPWEENYSLFKVLKNPQSFLRILGLCLSDKLVLSSNQIAEKIIQQLPFMKSKILIEPYSPEVYQNINAEGLKANILARFNIDKATLVLSAGACAENSIRALAKFKNIILFLQVNENESKYFMGLSQALGFLERIELISREADLLEIIPAMDIVISPGSGRYILNSIAAGIPVLITNDEETREWVYSEKFIYESNNVESLYNLVSKLIKDVKWKKLGIEECQSQFQNYSEGWGERVIKVAVDR